MKLLANRGSFRPPGRAGIATIVVLIVVMLLAALAMANAHVLAHLKAQLKQVETRQLKNASVFRSSTNASETTAAPANP